MALEDRDIFNAICARFPDQPLEVIMLQYEKAKKLNMDIEKRLEASECAAVMGAMRPQENAAAPEAEEAKPKLSRRDLKVKPKEAVTDEFISCCICGGQKKILTKTHLASHGLDAVEYRKLCGYPADMPLMSNRQLAVSRKIITRAQKARLDKRSAQED